VEARRWLRGVAIAIAMLAALEGGLRGVGAGGERRPRPRFVNPEGGWAAAGVYYEEDPALFWRLKKDASIVGGWYRTNADGFRGPLAVPRSPDVPRVVLLGDSVVFGLGLDDEATVGAHLEALLETRLARDVEVLQRAVPGYSSLQIAKLAEQELPRLRPDLTVILAGSFNDQAPACGASDSEIAAAMRAPPAGALGRLALWQGMRRLLGRGVSAGCPPLSMQPPPPGTPAPKTRVSVREFDANLRDILSVTRRVRSAAIVVVPPLSRKIASLQPWARRYRTAAARVGGCRIVDGQDAFGREAAATFQADELHPNRRGALVLALELAERISLDHTLGVPTEGGSIRSAIDLAHGVARQDEVERFVAQGRFDEALALAAHDNPATTTRRYRFAIARARARVGPCDFDLADFPGLVEARAVAAECSAQAGDDAAAIRHLRAGVRMDRGWVHGRFLLASALAEVGDAAAARRHLREGLRIAPDDEDLLDLSHRLE